MNPQIHETAVIDDGVTIGAGTRVWHWAHVSAGARIGRDCVLGQGVFIGAGVAIGDGVKIQNHVSVFEGVTLEDDVFVGPAAVFTNVRTPRAHVSRRQEYATTLVRHGATIGANATVVCGTTIGPYALVAAGAVVTRDVASHTLVRGVPAVPAGWACRCGEVLAVAADRATCVRCGDAYRLDGDALRMEP